MWPIGAIVFPCMSFNIEFALLEWSETFEGQAVTVDVLDLELLLFLQNTSRQLDVEREDSVPPMSPGLLPPSKPVRSRRLKELAW